MPHLRQNRRLRRPRTWCSRQKQFILPTVCILAAAGLAAAVSSSSCVAQVLDHRDTSSRDIHLGHGVGSTARSSGLYSRFSRFTCNRSQAQISSDGSASPVAASSSQCPCCSWERSHECGGSSLITHHRTAVKFAKDPRGVMLGQEAHTSAFICANLFGLSKSTLPSKSNHVESVHSLTNRHPQGTQRVCQCWPSQPMLATATYQQQVVACYQKQWCTGTHARSSSSHFVGWDCPVQRYPPFLSTDGGRRSSLSCGLDHMGVGRPQSEYGQRDKVKHEGKEDAEIGENEKADSGPPLKRPPLLITIGPQCAGKTTLLRELSERAKRRQGRDDDPALPILMSVTDIAIDDHPSVYYKIPVQSFLDGECSMDEAEGGAEIVQGRRLSDRLAEPACRETRLVALRLLRRISAEEFVRSMQKVGSKSSSKALEALSAAVERAVADGVLVSTPTVDVFVRESLFPLAISSAERRLETAATAETGIVAWGNTNTRVRDFRGALKQAQLTGRPVRFVRWAYELPAVSLEELNRRNILRFALTGRYVETAAVEIALERIGRMYESTGGGDPVQLALAAGFVMDASRRLTPLPPAPGDRVRASERRGGRKGEESRGTLAQDLDRRGPHRGAGIGGGDARSSNTGVGDGVAGQQPKRRSKRKRGKEEENKEPSSGAFSEWRSSEAALEYGPGDTMPLSSGSTRAGVMGGMGEMEVVPTVAPFAAAKQFRLAQEWRFRGDMSSWTGITPSAMGIMSRSMAAQVKHPTVVFKSEWGRFRAWRRSQYIEGDIALEPPDPASYFDRANGTTTGLKLFESTDGSLDGDEVNLLRRINDFRERR